MVRVASFGGSIRKPSQSTLVLNFPRHPSKPFLIISYTKHLPSIRSIEHKNIYIKLHFLAAPLFFYLSTSGVPICASGYVNSPVFHFFSHEAEAVPKGIL